MKYFDSLKKAMEILATNENVVFLGQAVEYPGTAMTNTLKDIDKDRLLEFPVAEEFQMGFSMGFGIRRKDSYIYLSQMELFTSCYKSIGQSFR